MHLCHNRPKQAVSGCTPAKTASLHPHCTLGRMSGQYVAAAVPGRGSDSSLVSTFNTMTKTILCTGGAGFIGSHTVVELFADAVGYDVVVVDNLVNSSLESIRRVQEITGKTVHFYQVDLLNKAELEAVFHAHSVHAVIHFAGLKAVGESGEKPLLYYHNNITGTLILLDVMQAHGCKNIVFSSSATVYGDPEELPLRETSRTGPTNPYGRTKLFIEDILRDVQIADKTWNVVNLRYFNPVGAHVSGRIGEDPKGTPNNLLPYIAQVVVGRREFLSVYGNDYKTHDGTGVRDYIHVVDLAKAHVAAVHYLDKSAGFVNLNLGTGQGYSVLDMVKAMSDASGKHIPYKIVGRRPGDVGTVYADVSLAEKTLGWKATKTLKDMCEDLWRWQSNNPNGFQS